MQKACIVFRGKTSHKWLNLTSLITIVTKIKDLDSGDTVVIFVGSTLTKRGIGPRLNVDINHCDVLIKLLFVY